MTKGYHNSTTERRPIKGFIKYSAGADGFIYSYAKSDCVLRRLVGGKDKDGYSKVILVDSGKRFHFRVHILIAKAWIGDKPDGMVVAHIDGDVRNNRPENLKYCTQRENIHDKEVHGTKLFGDTHTSSKVSSKDVLSMREDAKSMTNKQLSERYGLTQSGVYCIITRRTWKHI